MKTENDTDVEMHDELMENWSSELVEMLYDLFQTRVDTDEVLRVLAVASGDEVPAYLKQLPEHEIMDALVRRMFGRVAKDPGTFPEVQKTLRRARQVLSKNPFIDTFHSVMHAAKEDSRVMQVLYGLLLMMDAGQLDQYEVPELAWNSVSKRAKALGGTFSGDECLGTVDELVERVMSRMYRGDLDDEVAWQALSDMLFEVSPTAPDGWMYSHESPGVSLPEAIAIDNRDKVSCPKPVR